MLINSLDVCFKPFLPLHWVSKLSLLKKIYERTMENGVLW